MKYQDYIQVKPLKILVFVDKNNKPSVKKVVDVLNFVHGNNYVAKNFSGRVTDRNQYGKKQFALFLDPEIIDVQALIDEGWRIKTREYADSDKPTEYYINVDLNYNYNEPPEIDLIINAEDGGQPHGVHLGEEDVYQLDDVVFTAC